MKPLYHLKKSLYRFAQPLCQELYRPSLNYCVCRLLHAYTETAALTSPTTADLSCFLHLSVILRHGAPSDCGRTADVVEDLQHLCGSTYPTPYHPQSNDLTNMLLLYVSAGHKNWDAVLPFVTYAYNTAKHEVTGHAPFYLLYAGIPQTFLVTILLCTLNEDTYIAQTLCRAEEARRLARLRTLSSQVSTKARYDTCHFRSRRSRFTVDTSTEERLVSKFYLNV